MTRRARAAVAAIALGLAGCGYYAPPIRPDAATAEDATAGRDDAMRPDEAASEESDD